MKSKMKPELKQAWLEALRSGKFKQGRVYLRNTSEEFCCHGVLAEISGLTKWGDVARPYGINCYKLEFNDSYTYSSLTDDFREAVGMNQEDHSRLWAMNDDGKTFEEIANYIKEKL